MPKGTGLNGPTVSSSSSLAVNGNLHTFMNRFLGKNSAPSISLNEPSTSNELNASLPLMNDIEHL